MLYCPGMAKLLEVALKNLGELAARRQNEIARAVLEVVEGERGD